MRLFELVLRQQKRRSAEAAWRSPPPGVKVNVLNRDANKCSDPSPRGAVLFAFKLPLLHTPVNQLGLINGTAQVVTKSDPMKYIMHLSFNEPFSTLTKILVKLCHFPVLFQVGNAPFRL